MDPDSGRVYQAPGLSVEDLQWYHHPPDSRLKAAISERSLELIRRSSVALIGCGTVGAVFGLNMAQKGYGSEGSQMVICDYDLVLSENLATQVYRRDHLGRPKAFALAEMILESSPFPTRVIAVNMAFETLKDRAPELIHDVDLVAAAVDSGLWRAKISEYVHERAAYVTGGLSLDTTFGWCMWSTPEMPSFPRLLPSKSSGVSPGCSGVISDASYVVAGAMSYAADCALFKLKGHEEKNRRVSWQYRRFFLSGEFPDQIM